MKVLASLVAVLASSACIDRGDDHDPGEDSDLFEQAHEDNLLEPKADASDCSGVRVPDRGGFARRIALTFDDGPNPTTTPKVIEVLKAHGAPATFFTNGSRYSSDAARAVAQQIADDDDFILANHSQSHKNLAQQSSSTVTSEIMRTDELIRAAGETPKYFRFPFGSSTCLTKTIANQHQYVVTGWHIDSADWCYAAGGGVCKKSTFKYVPDAVRESMLGYVVSQARETGGGIVLLHDIHPNTANSLDAVLTALEADGFSFVRLDDDSVFPRLHGVAPM
jgi:peptidoglycan/xylan/chitin deacetylase (PgdA/CDA1 family)